MAENNFIGLLVNIGCSFFRLMVLKTCQQCLHLLRSLMIPWQCLMLISKLLPLPCPLPFSISNCKVGYRHLKTYVCWVFNSHTLTYEKSLITCQVECCISFNTWKCHFRAVPLAENLTIFTASLESICITLSILGVGASNMASKFKWMDFDLC